MIIDSNFIGGNIQVLKIEGDVVSIERELRDSSPDWFYWAFRVSGAQGRTITFQFPEPYRVGYWGPAVSHDLITWKWNNDTIIPGQEESFTYTFKENEDCVYFAHNMIYLPHHFESFVNEHNLEVLTLCKSRKGREVPYIRFGNGSRKIVLTSRHHACESTGSYVLQGVLEYLLTNPIEGYEVICVPFIDMDGVYDGDQGKNRLPHDHNRDYNPLVEPIYPETAEIRNLFENEEVTYFFDFHSPYHLGSKNDRVFIVHTSFEKEANTRIFSALLEENTSTDALSHKVLDDQMLGVGWNKEGTPSSTKYLIENKRNLLTFSIETPYFGEENDKVSQEKLVELGRVFARTIHAFDRQIGD